MHYLHWKDYISEKENIYTVFPSDFTINGLSAVESERRLAVPEPFERWEAENFATYLHPGSLITDHLDCFQTRVISGRLRAFLERRLGNEAQFLPIRLEAKDHTQTIDDYFIMHVIATAECLDLYKTDHSGTGVPGDEVILKPSSPIVLRREAIPSELRVMRDKRWYGNNLIIREDLAETLRRKRFTGLLFAGCEYSC